MKTLNFAKRNFKEIMREPLSIIFALIFPIFLLVLFEQFKIPNEVYKINNFTPGILIFGFSFITLFTSVLVSKDRSTSLTIRLCASPMKDSDYIFGYVLSVLPIVILQNILFFIVAIFLGLDFNINIILSILVSIPISILFISLGIFIGSLTKEKSASSVSSLVVQLCALTSGMYFDNNMVGKGFNFVCQTLPFSNTLTIIKQVLNGNYNNLLLPSINVIIYTLAIVIISSVVFSKKLKSDNK